MVFGAVVNNIWSSGSTHGSGDRTDQLLFDYNPRCDCLDLATILPEGMTFPYDFGFVPWTLDEDGNPLDILVLMDARVVPGCVIRARPVSAIEAKQKAKRED